MEFFANHLQVFVTMLVILGMAGVALAVDLLKSNNEHLREVNRELRTRVQSAMLAGPQLAGSASSFVALSAAPEAVRIQPERMKQSVARESLERGERVASRRTIADEVPVERATGASMAEARQLAREFLGRSAATERGEAMPASRQPAHQKPAQEVREPQLIHWQGEHQEAISRKDWNKLLTKTRHAEEPATVEVVAQHAARAPQQRMAELIPITSIQNPSADLTLPEGFHQGIMLARILSDENTVRGLVLVIGINDLASRRNRGALGSEALVASVGEHVKSLLKPGDFACQSSADEFLMICPNDREGAVQSRLSDIAEKLWDFQFQTVGASSILFSWGGFEAKGESMAAALSAAAERMHETRRSRRSLPIEMGLRRKAV